MMKLEQELRQMLADIELVTERKGGYDAAPEFARGMHQMLRFVLCETAIPGGDPSEDAHRAESFEILRTSANRFREEDAAQERARLQ